MISGQIPTGSKVSVVRVVSRDLVTDYRSVRGLERVDCLGFRVLMSAAW